MIGLHVDLDAIYPPMFIKMEKLVPAPNVLWASFLQRCLLKPIEIRVNLDATKAAAAAEGRLSIMLYDYDAGEWQELPSTFHAGTFQIRTYIQILKPIPGDYKGGWGGRAFFGVFEQMPTSTPIPEPTLESTPTLSSQSTANSSAALRRPRWCPATHRPASPNSDTGTGSSDDSSGSGGSYRNVQSYSYTGTYSNPG